MPLFSRMLTTDIFEKVKFFRLRRTIARQLFVAQAEEPEIRIGGHLREDAFDVCGGGPVDRRPGEHVGASFEDEIGGHGRPGEYCIGGRGRNVQLGSNDLGATSGAGVRFAAAGSAAGDERVAVYAIGNDAPLDRI